MALDRAELWDVRLPLRAAVDWTTGGREAEAPYLVLILHDGDGACGVAEITCRPAWNGMTSGLMARAFEELAWPRIAGQEPGRSVMTPLAEIRGMVALKALCDNAWHDLCSPMAGRLPVRAASVLTRAAPEIMTEMALQVRAEIGITAFKVKLGQGIAHDAKVLRALRSALGSLVELSGDANSAYGQSDLAQLTALAKEMEVSFLEDPFPLAPDAATGIACANNPVPVLVDRALEGPELVPAFADRGLVQVSAKPSRIGGTVALAVAEAALGRGGRVCNGTYAESALGAAAQIGFGQNLPEGLAHPHEIDFHRGLAEQIAPPPQIRDGHAMPITGRIADRLDRAALRRFGSLARDLRSGKATGREVGHG